MKKFMAFLMGMFLLTMTGCLDARPLDQYGYALCIGVDEGEATLYRVSFMLQKEGPSADETSGGFEVVSVEADTLSEAVMIAEGGLPYEVNLSRTNLLLISEKVAEGDLLHRFLMTDLGAKNIRANLDLAVIAGRTDDFMMGLRNDADPNTAKMHNTMLELSKNAGSLPSANLALFMEGVRGVAFDPILPFGVMDESIKPAKKDGEEQNPSEPAREFSTDMTGCFHGHDSALVATTERSGGLRSAFAGSAVFDGYCMKGFLSTLHTEVLLMARGEYRTGTLKLADGEGRLLSLGLAEDGKPKIVLTLSGMPKVTVTIPLTCRLEMEDSLAKGLAPIHEEALTRCVEEFLTRELTRVFLACRDAGADAFGFGRWAMREFLTVPEWEAYGWEEKYPLLCAEFHVTVKLVDRESTSVME